MCADIGSTYTKAALVDLADGRLLATAEHRTTAGTDVLRGLDAAVAATGADPDAPWYVCSSAGGGLRLAVVGHEQLVTAEAGRRVALTAGARVVHVNAGRLDDHATAALQVARPDVVLLVGGTDGGEADTIVHNAGQLAAARARHPVVAAGNVDARALVTGLLTDGGVPVVATSNVLPHIGELDPAPARAAIREVFLRHVIGGKELSAGERLGRLLRAATPDAVLTAVELLADRDAGDLLVVDVGGATTDVYSALAPDGAATEVSGVAWRARTVEGDLGMRAGAAGVVAAAQAERLLDPDEGGPLTRAADRRAATPGMLPDTAAEHRWERRLAGLAATVALRRHARGELAGDPAAGVRRGGRDLSAVRLAIGSGGVLRHGGEPETDGPDPLTQALRDHAGGWPVPRHPQVAVDQRYVLAAAGLLATEHPQAAMALLRRHLGAAGSSRGV